MSASPSRRLFAGVALAALLLTACGSSDGDDTSTTTTAASDGSTTTAAPGSTTTVPDARPLKILVSNDDGYEAAGIDALVVALQKLPDVEVTVYAPMKQQSGTGGKTTDGSVKVKNVKLKSGAPAKAVDGFPADTIRVAMDEEMLKPDLVVTGINQGQNLGPVADLSGTVGAARAAVARKVPALATSSGSATFDYAAGISFITEWIEEHRAALLDHTAPVEVTNLNTPSCASGTEVRGLVEVKADIGGDISKAVTDQDCGSTEPESSLTTDVIAFNNGFATLSVLPDAPEPAAD